MTAYARHEFRLLQRGKDGKTMRETLETVERMTRRRPAELENPHELSPLVAHIWRWYCEVSQGRQGGFAGAQPVSWSEIESYARQMRVRMQAWEARALRALDVAFLTQEPEHGS